MQEKNKLVEEALLQMKNVEEAIAENAKGILQSTMKEEISQLVKESLMEQPEDDLETPDDLDDEEVGDEIDTDFSDDEETGDEEEDFSDDEEEDFSDDEEEDFSDEIDMDFSDDEEVRDLSKLSDEELWDVWVKMDPNDGFQIKSDGDYLHLSDEETGKEYIAKSQSVSESNKERMKKTVASIFDESEDSDDIVYEIHFDETNDELDENPLLGRLAASAVGSYIGNKMSEPSDVDEEMYEYSNVDEKEIYEYSDGDDLDEEIYEYSDGDDLDEEIYEYSEMEDNLNEAKKKTELHSKKSFKSPGRVGKVKKVEFKSNTEGGFDEDKKEGPKREGKTGSASKAVKYSGENIEKGKNKVVKHVETKEAARGYAFGPKGLRKGITPNRNLSEDLENEVKMLREKNEEYRRALNIFREKLNEVAIFNSNLAYATRLFTEHSTTKKEKLNILRRFDNAETLKESKALYRTLKDELSKTNTSTISESIENKITKTVSTGSATTLIESKTYENPQFLRMKDLMSKLG